MNSQQAVQPKISANGYSWRAEKEGGLKSESKVLAGKLSHNRASNTVPVGKVGIYESPLRDRLVYLTTSLIGQLVDVQMKNGSTYTGICHTVNVDNDFAIVLKMARMTKDVSSRGKKVEFVSSPLKTFAVPGKEVIQVIAKDVPVTEEGRFGEFQQDKQQELMIDSFISQSHHTGTGRELKPWVPDDDTGPEFENIFDGNWNRGWDQFETNEMLFGVKSTFDEEIYTTKLERGPQMRELEKEAIRIAREIENEDTQDLHLAEERGIQNVNFDIDEETRFSSVYRDSVVDDGGYEEEEDILLNSRNTETFGDASTSSTEKPTDLAPMNSNDDDFQCSASSSLDEHYHFQSSSDSYQSSSHDHVRELASELQSSSNSTSGGDNRIQENLPVELEKKHHVEGYSVQQPLAEDSRLSKLEVVGSQSSLNEEKDGSDQGELTDCLQASSKSHQKMSVRSEEPATAASAKGAIHLQSMSSHVGSASLAMSTSDSAGASLTSTGSGLSPSSSVGSFASEKSTLNPYAKEFKLNPNAKSFTPSQKQVRPPSTVSDGSFYYPANVPTTPHMHGMPMGIGIVPPFSGHQPAMYNPQVSPMQSPQGYFLPGGPQYGQQMLGHPRPVMYMPNYQPEMSFKGPDY